MIAYRVLGYVGPALSPLLVGSPVRRPGISLVRAWRPVEPGPEVRITCASPPMRRWSATYNSRPDGTKSSQVDQRAALSRPLARSWGKNRPELLAQQMVTYNYGIPADASYRIAYVCLWDPRRCRLALFLPEGAAMVGTSRGELE
jgi:hypothetical protein